MVDSLALSDVGITGKIFCISMQRSGTSSVGDFLGQWGLKRAGHPLSRIQRWSRHWMNGNYEAIFNDPAFIEHEVFEDDPWWFPDFFKVVFHRVPDSRFILLSRDADGWFKSMVRHSRGFSLGQTDIHAKVYRREDDLAWLARNIPDFKQNAPQGMTIFDKSEQYKGAYQRHTREASAFFAANGSEALFNSNLLDPEVWVSMKEWLQLPDRDGVLMGVHAHKARGEFRSEHLLQRPSSPKRPGPKAAGSKA